jgi:hypothetical protein
MKLQMFLLPVAVIAKWVDRGLKREQRVDERTGGCRGDKVPSEGTGQKRGLSAVEGVQCCRGDIVVIEKIKGRRGALGGHGAVEGTKGHIGT